MQYVCALVVCTTIKYCSAEERMQKLVSKRLPGAFSLFNTNDRNCTGGAAIGMRVCKVRVQDFSAHRCTFSGAGDQPQW